MGFILWLHRYLGVAIGALMVLWCLSGFVMMYQGWPAVDEDERVRILPILELAGRGDLSALPLGEDAAPGDFRVEMLGNTPVLRTGSGIFDLRDGARIEEIGAEEARLVAAAYAEGHDVAGDIGFGALADADQWTIQQRRAAPFWRFDADDPARTVIYVSAATGEVAQAVNGRERFWTWLGAIPHWLYPTILRQHSGTWFQVVVWTSALGVFLTVTGLYVGISRFRRRPNGRWSPYRKLWLWHHYTGLIFGVLTLTWVFSGLLTMGPFWPMQSAPFPEARTINAPAPWSQARPALEAALARPDAETFVRIESAPLGGSAHVIATRADGERVRLDGGGAEAPLDRAALASVLSAGGGAFTDAEIETLTREDAYYYGHHREVELPVYRVRLHDEENRALYISAASGQVLRMVDDGARLHRWFESGLHSLDFPGLRARPVWDIVVLPLLGGVTLLCIIGVWLAWRRVKRDARMLTYRAGGGRGARTRPSPGRPSA